MGSFLQQIPKILEQLPKDHALAGLVVVLYFIVPLGFFKSSFFGQLSASTRKHLSICFVYCGSFIVLAIVIATIAYGFVHREARAQNLEESIRGQDQVQSGIRKGRVVGGIFLRDFRVNSTIIHCIVRIQKMSPIQPPPALAMWEALRGAGDCIGFGGDPRPL
jgi:hypothetical protein